MNALIYCRVSSPEQVKGYSLQGQEQECRKFGINIGYKIDKVFVERGESAKTQNRTELKKLIKYTVENKKKLSALIIWKYDRLARNLSDQTELVKHFSSLNIRVLSATENNEDGSVGNLMRNIIGSFAQYENDVKKERTTNGMKASLKNGRWCWKAPIGYKNIKDKFNKPLISPSEEAKFIIEAFNLAQTGLHKQTDIVDKLKKKGFKQITKSLLNRTLKNPLYCGLIKVDWFSEYIEAIHEPIISKEIYWKVQRILNGKKPNIAPKQRNHPDFPLRRFIRCSKCGQKLTGAFSTGRKGVKYPYYRCHTKGCSLNVKKQVLESEFYNYLKDLQPNKDILDLFEAIMLDVWKNKQEEKIKEEHRLQKELKNLKNKKDRIDELMINKIFDEKTYKQRTEEIETEIMTKQIELNETKIELNDIEACLNYCKFFLANIADLWINSSLNLKQRFQNLIFPDKIYYDGKSLRTTKIALIFKYLQQKPLQKSQLVAPTGFIRPPLADSWIH